MRDTHEVMLIRDLEWVLALAEYEHLTDTAATLGVSQPTLSRALARVEAELGLRLFERVSTGLVTTPNGELVIAAAQEIKTRYQQLVREMTARLDPDRGVVRLAFLDSMATSLVPRLLGGFHRQAPAVRVILNQEPAHVMERDLARAAVDLAITSSRPAGATEWLELQHERLVLAVPAGHRLAGRKELDLREIGGEELITTPVGYGFRKVVSDLLAESAVAPGIAFESVDLATIEGLVSAGLGVAVVPEQFAGLTGSVAVGIASRRARRTIGLTWRADRPLDPAAARFVDHVRREVLGGGGEAP